jgi:hypothetical protein
VVCRCLCNTANRNKTAGINWTQREQEITPHASHLIKGVGTEGPKFEICNIVTAVLLNVVIFCVVTPYSRVCVCVVSAIFRGLNAFIPHLECNNLCRKVQYYDPWMISHHSPTTEPSITAHWSRPHKGHFIQYSVVLWTNFDYEWALHISSWRKICRLHIVMRVSHLYLYEMNYISVCKSYFLTAEIRSPPQEHLAWTPKVE